MVHDLFYLFFNLYVGFLLESLAEAIHSKDSAQLSLISGNVSDEVFFGEIAVHSQESV